VSSSVTSAKSRLTGERPQQGVTPDSLLALHEAGYRAVLERIGTGRILDVGCGQGFESARFLGPGREVVGADYSPEAVRTASARYGPEGLRVAQMDATALGFRTASFDGACSSHLIEHFRDPEPHVAELARVLKPAGVACVLTPNKPTDFENPFHVHLFDRTELRAMLERAPLAYVPVGTIEFHGEHLPFGVDSFEAHALCVRAAERSGGVVLPPVYLASGCLDLPGTLSFEPALVEAWVRATVDGLAGRGFRAIVVLTGHGPLDLNHLLKRVCAEAEAAHEGLRAYALCWLELNAARLSGPEPGVYTLAATEVEPGSNTPLEAAWGAVARNPDGTFGSTVMT